MMGIADEILEGNRSEFLQWEKQVYGKLPKHWQQYSEKVRDYIADLYWKKKMTVDQAVTASLKFIKANGE